MNEKEKTTLCCKFPANFIGNEFSFLLNFSLSSKNRQQNIFNIWQGDERIVLELFQTVSSIGFWFQFARCRLEIPSHVVQPNERLTFLCVFRGSLVSFIVQRRDSEGKVHRTMVESRLNKFSEGFSKSSLEQRLYIGSDR